MEGASGANAKELTTCWNIIWRNPFILQLAFSAGVGGLLFGYDTGVISGALLYIRDDFKAVDKSTILQETIVSVTIAAAIIGSAVGGYSNDKYGRKPSILAADIVFAFGAVLMAAAPNPGVLIGGRVLVGLGVGVASVSVPLYIAEASPAKIRGALVSTNSFMITGGQFLSYLINLAFTKVPGTWRWMLGVAGAPAVLQLVLVLFLPESPRWLYRQNKVDEAVTILERLYPKEEVGSEVAALKDAVDAEEKERQSFRKILELLKSPEMRPAVVAGVGLSGATSPGTCLASEKEVGDMCKRVRASSGAWFTRGCPSRFGWLAILGLAMYIIFFSPGMGIVPWAVNSEIYPLRYRGIGGGLAATCLWISNLIVSETFLSLTHAVGPSFTFLIFCGIACFTLVFVVLFVPETKGLSLEKLETLLQELYREKQKGKFGWLCYLLRRPYDFSSDNDKSGKPSVENQA